MFNADPTLYYNAQQSLTNGFDSLKSKRSEIEVLTSSFPRGFEYKTEITEVTQDLNSIIRELSSLTRRVSETKDSLIKLDNLFGLIYYECASAKYDDLHGCLTNEEKAYVEFAQQQYNKMLFQYLDDLNKSGNLTPEMKSIYEQLKISNKLNELENKLEGLKEGSKEYESVMNQYNKELDNMLNLQISQLENKDSLTKEEQATLKSLKDTKNISAYEKELAELEKNPVRNPGVPGGRMTEAQAKAYAEQSKAYWDYENKKKDLKKKIENIQRENGTYVNKWYEDIGESITKTSAQWKKGFSSALKGEGLGELGNAVKQTVATGAVVYKSAQNGVLKVGEILLDGATAVVGSVAAGVTWLAHDSWSDNDLAGNVMDWTLDEMRKDRVGDANRNFYENTEFGKWINENSNLKYDSAGAQSIQTATEFAGKLVLATAATVASGGAAAAAIGAVYGIGKAGEKYTQSVDRENGDDYNYLKFLGKSAAGGLSGAAEFYGYGQMGASIYGGIKSLSGAATSLASNTTTKTATTFGKSFAKNFLEVDTFLDSGAVIVDHGVNLATGDETLSESLKNAGIEFGLALGLNAIGAGIGAKIETKAAKVDIDTSSLPRESTSVKKILGDKISVVSTKVKTAGTNFAESLKNAKTKLDLMVINISTNPTVNNILSSPMMAELATNSDSAILFGSTSFIKESLNVLANKRAVKEVIENADFTQKILKEGMVHFTPNEDVADAIISSQVLKTKKLGFDINHPIKSVKNDVEYLANQGSKAFLFGGIPSYEEMVLNVDIQPTMVGVRIKPDESQLANLGYRYLDDNALIHNGDLDLSPSKSVEKVYVGLKQDKATNRFYYEEITKAEFDNYKLDIDESEFKKLKSTVAKTKTQIDLTYGNMKSELDAKIIDNAQLSSLDDSINTTIVDNISSSSLDNSIDIPNVKEIDFLEDNLDYKNVDLSTASKVQVESEIETLKVEKIQTTISDTRIKFGEKSFTNFSESDMQFITTELKNVGLSIEMLNSSNLDSTQMYEIQSIFDYIMKHGSNKNNYLSISNEVDELYNRTIKNINDLMNDTEKTSIYKEYILGVSDLIENDKNISKDIINIIDNKILSTSSINDLDFSLTTSEKEVIVNILQKTNNLKDLTYLEDMDFSAKEVLQKYLKTGAASTLLTSTSKEYNSLFGYMSSNFKNINTYLDTGVDVNMSGFGSNASEFVENMDNVMDRSRLTSTYILQRGATVSDFDGVTLEELPGTVMTHNRYRSSCMDYNNNIGTKFGGNALYADESMKVKIDYICPADTKAVNLGMVTSNNVESEVLLGRNQRIRYEAVKMDGDTACVLATVLPDGYALDTKISDLVDEDTFKLISSRYNISDIPQVKNPKFGSNIDINANKKTFDDVYDTLYNKYGEEEALSRISKYIETGNANVITRDNNARTLISSLSMEELTKHVDDIKGASYFNVAGDLIEDSNILKRTGDLTDGGDLEVIRSLDLNRIKEFNSAEVAFSLKNGDSDVIKRVFKESELSELKKSLSSLSDTEINKVMENIDLVDYHKLYRVLSESDIVKRIDALSDKGLNKVINMLRAEKNGLELLSMNKEFVDGISLKANVDTLKVIFSTNAESLKYKLSKQLDNSTLLSLVGDGDGYFENLLKKYPLSEWITNKEEAAKFVPVFLRDNVINPENFAEIDSIIKKYNLGRNFSFMDKDLYFMAKSTYEQFVFENTSDINIAKNIMMNKSPDDLMILLSTEQGKKVFKDILYKVDDVEFNKYLSRLDDFSQVDFDGIDEAVSLMKRMDTDNIDTLIHSCDSSDINEILNKLDSTQLNRLLKMSFQYTNTSTALTNSDFLEKAISLNLFSNSDFNMFVSQIIKNDDLNYKNFKTIQKYSSSTGFFKKYHLNLGDYDSRVLDATTFGYNTMMKNFKKQFGRYLPEGRLESVYDSFIFKSQEDFIKLGHSENCMAFNNSRGQSVMNVDVGKDAGIDTITRQTVLKANVNHESLHQISRSLNMTNITGVKDSEIYRGINEAFTELINKKSLGKDYPKVAYCAYQPAVKELERLLNYAKIKDKDIFDIYFNNNRVQLDDLFKNEFNLDDNSYQKLIKAFYDATEAKTAEAKDIALNELSKMVTSITLR